MENQKTSPQLGIIQTFEFQKTPVMAGICPTGEMIAVRPCVENLGLDWSWQLQALKKDRTFGQLWGTEKAISSDGRSRDMVCLPPAAFQEWLWNLNPQSENFKADLWEEYKKGLVMHILMMLKISLDKIEDLQSENEVYKKVRKLQVEINGLDGQINELEKDLKELRTERSTKFKERDFLLSQDPNQLALALYPN